MRKQNGNFFFFFLAQNNYGMRQWDELLSVIEFKIHSKEFPFNLVQVYVKWIKVILPTKTFSKFT